MDNLWTSCIGNLGSDVKTQYTDGGKLFAKVGVAVETGWGDKKTTEWVNATVWGEDAGNRFKEFCHKGTKVYLSGNQSVNRWTSKDGEEKFSIELTVKEFRVLSGGKPKGEEESTPYDGE